MPISPDRKCLNSENFTLESRRHTLQKYCQEYEVKPTPGVSLCDPSTVLSVVVPAFNERDFIGQCLRHLGASTVPIEIVVVDNNSDDGTSAVAEQVAGELPHPVTVLHAKDKGPVHARKRGLDEVIAQYVAKNDVVGRRYIALTDADTLVPPDWAASIVQVAQQTGAAALGGKYHYPYELDTIIAEATGVTDFFRYLGEVAYYLSDKGVAFIHTCGANFAIEVESYAAIGGSQQPRDEYGNPIKGNDLRFGHAVRAIGGEVAFIPTQTIPSARREIFSLSKKTPQNNFSSMQGWVDCRMQDIDLLKTIVHDLDPSDLWRHREERASRFMNRTIILPALTGEIDLGKLAGLVGEDDATVQAIHLGRELILGQNANYVVELALHLSTTYYRDFLDKIWVAATATPPPQL